MRADNSKGRVRTLLGAPFVKLAVIVCAAAPGFLWAAPIGSSVSNEALSQCRRADVFIGAEREKVLEEGSRMAEQAVALDDDDATAHFALFCTLGKRLKDTALGPAMLTNVRRLRHEIDRAIELAPQDPELWAAKGAMLLTLPSFLGGDRDEAQQLLVRAFVADPDNHVTRVYLEESLQ